jgi:quercetin dioxygenase-like cupin family protein
MTRSVKLITLFGVAVGLAVSSILVAQQQTATRRIPEFENDHVRVWKSIIAPRQPLSMHRHDHPRVIVALMGGTLKIVEESGASRDVTWETGRAYWLPADPRDERHADVNETDAPIQVIVVELKNAR